MVYLNIHKKTCKISNIYFVIYAGNRIFYIWLHQYRREVIKYPNGIPFKQILERYDIKSRGLTLRSESCIQCWRGNRKYFRQKVHSPARDERCPVKSEDPADRNGNHCLGLKVTCNYPPHFWWSLRKHLRVSKKVLNWRFVTFKTFSLQTFSQIYRSGNIIIVTYPTEK